MEKFANPRPQASAISKTEFMKRLLLALLITTLGSFSPASYAEWKLLGHRDMYRVVLMDETDANSTIAYWNALQQVCKSNYCNVIFIRDAESIEVNSTNRLEDSDFDNALLIYSTNRGFQWNCHFRPSADNCFKWK